MAGTGPAATTANEEEEEDSSSDGFSPLSQTAAISCVRKAPKTNLSSPVDAAMTAVLSGPLRGERPPCFLFDFRPLLLVHEVL